MKRKVKIEALPKARTGQQVGYGLYNRLATMGGLSDTRPSNDLGVSRTIGAVPREDATIEAEGGETVFGDIAGIGIPQHYTITGPRHAQGGVPMALDGGEFIFSDYHNMKLKDPEALSYFGKTAKKGGKGKGFTYADIAKQYDINKYLKILKDPNSDDIDKRTAERMIENFNLKLGALGLHQEAQKGFEQGVPEVSRPYMEKMGITEEDLGIVPQEEMSPEMMMFGGQSKRKLKRCTTCGHKQEGGIILLDTNDNDGIYNWTQQDNEFYKKAFDQSMNQLTKNLYPQNVNNAQRAADQKAFIQSQFENNIERSDKNIRDAFIQSWVNPSEPVFYERQMGGPGAEMMGQEQMMDPSMMGQPGMEQQQDPMAQIMPIVEQMISQGADPNQIAVELLGMGVEPEMIMEVFIQMGMPEGEAQMAIEAAMSDMQQPEMMDPAMMEGQGMSPEMMPEMDPAMGMMQMGGMQQEPSLEDMIVEALQQGASPDEVLQALVQNGVPEQEAQQAVSNVAQQMQAPQQQMMQKGGVKKYQTAGQIPTKASANPTFPKQTKVGNYYGKVNKELFDETVARNQWFDWTDFDPSNPEDVKRFQREYNELVDKYNLDANKVKVDGKIGEQTQSINVGYDPDEEDKDDVDEIDEVDDVEEETVDPNRPDIVDPNIQEYRDPIEADWTTPDIVNFRGAISDRLGAKTYYPHAQMYSPQFADPTFYDVSRTAAGIGEQSNIAAQALGQFTGPQALSARMASIQGQGAKAMADAIGNYDDRNVGIANQFAMQNAQTANQAQLQNLDRMKRFYDEGTIAQQQRDNTRRQLDANIRKTFGDGFGNASNIALMNATSEQYNIDPRTGRVVFTGVDKPMDNSKLAKDYDAKLREYMETLGDPKAAVQAANNWQRTQAGKPSFAQKGGYVMGTNVFPFMFY